MADSFHTIKTKDVLLELSNSDLPCKTMPSKMERTFFIEKPEIMKDERTFGEVYLCNEQTFGEFFRIQEFDTFKIEKFQGTEDKVFVFYQDENDENKIAVIQK